MGFQEFVLIRLGMRILQVENFKMEVAVPVVLSDITICILLALIRKWIVIEVSQ